MTMATLTLRVSRKFNKKLKKGHNPKDDSGLTISHEEIDIDDKNENPFHVHVIIDIVFQMLSFEDVKKFRQVSTIWNEVGLKELSRRPQKPINFHDIEELRSEDKLGELVQLQKSHNMIFPTYHHQLFSKFSINISVLWTYHQVTTSSPIDIFFKFFTPTFIHFYGSLRYIYPDSSKEEDEDCLSHFLCKFLIKISLTVQEIDFEDFNIKFKNKENVELAVAQELTRTKFPNLRKISNNISTFSLQKMFFYPIIGQNLPKLNHLVLGSKFGSFTGISLDELKEKFESSELISKLKILELLNIKAELLDLFADFGQRGLLKLNKLNCKNDNSSSVQIKDSFVRLISTQGDSLKILKISTPYSFMDNTIRVQFPQLQNLTSLQIDNISSFQAFFEHINFSIVLPKLQVFQTFGISEEFEDLEAGDSIKFVSFLKHSSNSCFAANFTKIYEIFPNLEFLELNWAFIPSLWTEEEKEKFPLWSRLRKVRIHCSTFGFLYYFDSYYADFLKNAKKIEIVVHCGNSLVLEEYYKNDIAKLNYEGPDNMDNYRREKLYQKCLAQISEQLRSIVNLTSISIIGYKISENFKRDFTSLFPDCTFVSCPFKATKNY